MLIKNKRLDKNMASKASQLLNSWALIKRSHQWTIKVREALKTWSVSQWIKFQKASNTESQIRKINLRIKLHHLKDSSNRSNNSNKSNKRSQKEVNRKLREAVDQKKKMESLSSTMITLTNWYFNQKIFGSLNSMHRGVAIARHLSLNTPKQPKILKVKSNWVRLMLLLRKDSVRDSQYKASQPSKFSTTEWPSQ